MGHFWTLMTYLHNLAGPSITLLYPLYASVIALETHTTLDDEQWLAYWILYSFLTLLEMLAAPALQWIPIWYDVKVLFVAWLVLPQFRGAAFIYERFVRENLRKYGAGVLRKDHHHYSSYKSSPPPAAAVGKKIKFVDSLIPKSGEHEAY